MVTDQPFYAELGVSRKCLKFTAVLLDTNSKIPSALVHEMLILLAL